MEQRRRPAWEDPDDEMEEVDIAGRDRLRKLRQAEDETTVTGEQTQLFPLSWPSRLLWFLVGQTSGMGLRLLDMLLETCKEQRLG